MTAEGFVAQYPGFLATVEPRLAGAVNATLAKLQRDHTQPSLHVEPMFTPVDARARTVRVNDKYRMVVFQLDNPEGGTPNWVAYGVYNHDDAIKVAKTAYLNVNPFSGQPEIRISTAPLPGTPEYEARLRAEAKRRADAILAERQAEADAAAHSGVAEASVEGARVSSNGEIAAASQKALTGITMSDLTGLGFDPNIAGAAVAASLTEIDSVIARLEAGTWQHAALWELATGATLDDIRENYVREVNGDTAASERRIGDEPSSTEAVLEALQSDKARPFFHIIESDEEFENVLAAGNFAAWKVFLHPLQKRYVDLNSNGPYRLTGGAGTGKTVVLVHRAVRLARENTGARILATTYTRNMANDLADSILSLDPHVQIARKVGDEGIHTSTLDSVAATITLRARNLPSAMESVLGWGSSNLAANINNDVKFWETVIRSTHTGLESRLLNPHFLLSEYEEVILPQRITTEAAYMRALRKGRGVSLGRNQRRDIWAIVSNYRNESRRLNQVSYTEKIAIASAVLDANALAGMGRQYDHVLVDEAQDLNPPRLQLIRALVEEGRNDVFLAGDDHQRIYGNAVRPGHYGLNIQGRSRRLRLNYRTTAENLDLAMRIIEGGNYNDFNGLETGEEETSSLGTVGEYRSARSGPMPTRIGTGGLAEEYDAAAEILRQWIKEIQEAEARDAADDDDNLTGAGAMGAADGTDAVDGLGNRIGILTHNRTIRDQFVSAMQERGLTVATIDRSETPHNYPSAMTLHRAKGTEFERVLLFGMDDGTIPAHQRAYAYDERAHEEALLRERSLLYVGATRARDQLAILWAKTPSPLLPAMPSVHQESNNP